MSKLSNLLISILLFVFGMAVGHLLPFDSQHLKMANTVFGIVGGISTFIAAFAAIIALNIWKKQFNHSEVYKLLNAFEDSFSDLIKAITQYRQTVIQVVKFECSPTSNLDYDELKRSEHEAKQQYFRSRELYFAAFERLARERDLSEYKQLSPDMLQSSIVTLINGVRPIYKTSDFDESIRLLDENDNLLVNLWNQAKPEFKLLRKNC